MRTNRRKAQDVSYPDRVTVAFLTHPLGERDDDWGMRRGDNLANAMGWFKFLKDVTGWAICFPELAYIAAGLDDGFYRRSMLVDSVEILDRCDVLVPVGGKLSPHMRIALEHANGKSTPIPVLSLLDLGDSPPWERKDTAGIEIRRRADALGL